MHKPSKSCLLSWSLISISAAVAAATGTPSAPVASPASAAVSPPAAVAPAKGTVAGAATSAPVQVGASVSATVPPVQEKASAAAAPQATGPAKCNPEGTQAEMNVCAAEDYKKEEERLKEVYAELRTKFPEPQLARFQEVQKLWLVYRDAQCAFEAAEYEGGSMQPMVRDGCLGNLTSDRIRILEEMKESESQ